MDFSLDSRRWASISFVLAAGAAVLYRFDPTVARFYPPCIFHLLTGLECPGCGSTRAVYHLLHGDVAGAFRFNPLLFIAVPFLLIAARWPRILAKPSVAWAVGAVMIGYGIVRNLPFWPYPL